MIEVKDDSYLDLQCLKTDKENKKINRLPVVLTIHAKGYERALCDIEEQKNKIASTWRMKL